MLTFYILQKKILCLNLIFGDELVSLGQVVSDPGKPEIMVSILSQDEKIIV